MTDLQNVITYLALFYVGGLNALWMFNLAYESKNGWRLAFASVGLFQLLVTGYSGFRSVQSLMT